MSTIVKTMWLLQCHFCSGSAIMQDGSTIRNGYPLDLDSMTTGCRIGMMRCSNGTLHYFLNGIDQGVACSNIPAGKLMEWTYCVFRIWWKWYYFVLHIHHLRSRSLIFEENNVKGLWSLVSGLSSQSSACENSGVITESVGNCLQCCCCNPEILMINPCFRFCVHVL